MLWFCYYIPNSAISSYLNSNACSTIRASSNYLGITNQWGPPTIPWGIRYIGPHSFIAIWTYYFLSMHFIQFARKSLLKLLLKFELKPDRLYLSIALFTAFWWPVWPSSSQLTKCLNTVNGLNGIPKPNSIAPSARFSNITSASSLSSISKQQLNRNFLNINGDYSP